MSINAHLTNMDISSCLEFEFVSMNYAQGIFNFAE